MPIKAFLSILLILVCAIGCTPPTESVVTKTIVNDSFSLSETESDLTELPDQNLQDKNLDDTYRDAIKWSQANLKASQKKDKPDIILNDSGNELLQFQNQTTPNNHYSNPKWFPDDELQQDSPKIVLHVPSIFNLELEATNDVLDIDKAYVNADIGNNEQYRNTTADSRKRPYGNPTKHVFTIISNLRSDSTGSLDEYVTIFNYLGRPIDIERMNVTRKEYNEWLLIARALAVEEIKTQLEKWTDIFAKSNPKRNIQHWINLFWLTEDDLGLTNEQVQHLLLLGEKNERDRRVREAKRQYHLEYIDSGRTNLYALKKVLDSNLLPQELDITEEEFRQLRQEYYKPGRVEYGKRLFKACIEDSARFPELQRLLIELSPTDLGTHQDQVDNLQHRYNVSVARSLTRLCQQGFTDSAMQLEALIENGVSFDEAGTTPVELKKWLTKKE